MENKSPIDPVEIHNIHKQISELANNYQNAMVDVNNACLNLNGEIEPLITKRSPYATLYLGNEAAPILGSLKTLGEKIFQENFSYNKNIEKNLQKATFDMEKGSQKLESLTANLDNNMQSLESVMEYLKCSIGGTPTLDENDLSSTVSDISSSSEFTNIVTSSPYSSCDRNDDEK